MINGVKKHIMSPIGPVDDGMTVTHMLYHGLTMAHTTTLQRHVLGNIYI